MDLIGLPGNNPETGPWLEQLASRLALGQTSTQIRRYRHWDEPGKPDIQYEASRLRILPGDVVVAKSLGTLILLAHSDRPDQAGTAGDDHLYADTEALADRIASWWQTIA